MLVPLFRNEIRSLGLEFFGGRVGFLVVVFGCFFFLPVGKLRLGFSQQND